MTLPHSGFNIHGTFRTRLLQLLWLHWGGLHTESHAPHGQAHWGTHGAEAGHVEAERKGCLGKCRVWTKEDGAEALGGDVGQGWRWKALPGEHGRI